MHAIRIHTPGGPEVLQLEQLPTPTPGPGQVLIEVALAGVNYADLLALRGGTHGPHRATLPATPGFEVAGVVAALGPGVAGPVIGTRVVAVLEAGGYAEYAVADAGRALPLLPEIDFATGLGLLIQGLTAYGVLHDSARLQPGERVLVQAAAGGVGSLAVQLARLGGAATVLGTASTPAKRELVLQLGADHAIDYTQPDWVAQVLAATGGHGVDIVLESVGGAIGGQAFQSLAPLGRLVMFGGASGPLELPDLMLLNMRGLTLSGYGGPWLRPGRAQAAWEQLVSYVRSGQLRVVRGPAFPLAHAAEALGALISRRTTGKVVLTVR